MGLEDFLISTGVDALIKLVHDRRRIEIKDASVQLGIPISTVEDWAKTLESEKLIRIEYKITSVFLVWAGLSEGEYQEKIGEIEGKKGQALGRLEGLKKTVDQNIEELEGMQQQFGKAKEQTGARLGKIGEDFLEAQKIGEQAQEVVGEKKKILEKLKIELDRARKELESFEKYMAESPQAKEVAKQDPRELIKNLESASARLEGRIDAASRDFEEITSKVEEIRNALDTEKSTADISDLKKDVEDMKFARGELLKSARSLLEEGKAIGERLSSAEEKIKKMEDRKNMKVDTKKLKDEIDAIYSKAVKDSEAMMYELQNNMMVIRKQVQDYTQAAYQYQTLDAHLSSIRSQYSQESGELEKMISLIDEASKKYSSDLEGAKEALGSQKKEFEELAEKAKRIEMILSNVEALKAEGQNLSTKLKGLMMESAVVDMAAPAGMAGTYKPAKGSKAGGSPSEEFEALPAELVQKINLSDDEEKAFERKREELRWLIHRMMEEKGESK